MGKSSGSLSLLKQSTNKWGHLIKAFVLVVGGGAWWETPSINLSPFTGADI
jgi:hypothetical protein